MSKDKKTEKEITEKLITAAKLGDPHKNVKRGIVEPPKDKE